MIITPVSYTHLTEIEIEAQLIRLMPVGAFDNNYDIKAYATYNPLELAEKIKRLSLIHIYQEVVRVDFHDTDPLPYEQPLNVIPVTTERNNPVSYTHLRLSENALIMFLWTIVMRVK